MVCEYQLIENLQSILLPLQSCDAPGFNRQSDSTELQKFRSLTNMFIDCLL